ncbi:LINE-1 reverse transcriptase [Ananas comosus]|uniref:LINE-1 reverse transcriptase n=1 Tax=Ananas comosus TaxID=4615 RepID=A0A199V9F3_ANACO|nr:LINE-1 reverse transcriptase [Ananas comosus]
MGFQDNEWAYWSVRSSDEDDKRALEIQEGSNLQLITRPFGAEEVKQAVFQLGRDKAPGPDGFPLCFYQSFWDTLKDDIMNIFHEMFEGTLNTGPIDYAYICLIPKKEAANRANDFRPISLTNGIHKILSKVLTNRLESIMGTLISDSQSAFLKGRNISDAFVTVRELFGWGSKLGMEGVGIKVDFEKAYDRTYWPFLFRIMEWWGFDRKWINWVKLCVCSAKVAVLVNGVPTNWIKTKRGLRQGDPLSPFLFLLIAECLTRLTDGAATKNLICGIGPSDDSRVHIIQFADDTFFFCEAKKRFMRNLIFLWKLFEWASGMRINKDKSEIFYLGSAEGKASRLAHILGCKLGTLPTKYLGLPLTTRPPSKEDWRGIISKIQSRIDGWQAKLLSRGGRLVLVNAVLTNLPIHFLTVFHTPNWVVKRIEVLRRDFFWKGNTGPPGKGCLVAWKCVCRSKEEGGLGILDLASMNQALLVKWWWKLLTMPNPQWNKLIHALFYPRRRPLKEGRSFKPSSFWWKGVLGQKDIFKWGLIFGPTDGVGKPHFRHPFRSYPPSHPIKPDPTGSQHFRPQSPAEHRGLKGKDFYLRDSTRNGQCVLAVDLGRTTFDIWRLRIPLKVKKKVTHYGQPVEKRKRLIIFSHNALWSDSLWLRELGDDVHRLWDIWRDRKGSNNDLSGIIACWWVAWETRNGVIFAKAQADPIRGTHKIKHLIAQAADRPRS